MFLLELLFGSIGFLIGIIIGCFISVFVFLEVKSKTVIIPTAIGGFLLFFGVCALMVGNILGVGIIQVDLGFIIGYIVCYSVAYIINYAVRKSSPNKGKDTDHKEMTQNDIELNLLIQKYTQKAEGETDNNGD